MVRIIKNSYLEHILNRMACEFRGGCGCQIRFACKDVMNAGDQIVRGLAEGAVKG